MKLIPDQVKARNFYYMQFQTLNTGAITLKQFDTPPVLVVNLTF